jgi:uncharacterized protein
MPHQCVRCRTLFEDGAQEILKGCNCGGKLFFFVKKERIKELEQLSNQATLSQEDKVQMEQDIYDLIGTSADKDEPIILDIEAIRVLEPGKYELDLIHLLNKEPLIFKLEDGKYMIDLVQSFHNFRKK